METLSKQPGNSIWASSENRAEAKAIYHMLGNEKFDRDEILKAHREGTVKRMADEPVILAVQDTTAVNYDGRRKIEGNGYISDKTMGVNIHTCLAATANIWASPFIIKRDTPDYLFNEKLQTGIIFGF
jgi:hypothetical protein